MQTRSRLAVRFFVFVSALVATALALVTGCSSGTEESTADLPDAATLLQESGQTTHDQESVHLTLTVQGEIEGLPIELLEGDLTNVPAVAAQGTADINFLGQRLEGVDFIVADGNLYGAVTADRWQDFGPAADIYDPAAILNPDTGLANLLADFTEATAEGRESVAGVDTVRITGTVTADAVNQIAPQIGATGPVPAVAWIREDGDHELVQAELEPSEGNSVTMTLTDWGKPVTVTKPAV